MEIHRASLCRARSAATHAAFVGDVGDGVGAGVAGPARVPERSLFMDWPLHGGHVTPTGVGPMDFFRDGPSFRADSHIYEEVGPPELPPTLPPYYKKHVDPWCPCQMCWVDYATSAEAAGLHPPPYEGGCRDGSRCCGRASVYSVIRPRGVCQAAASGGCVHQQTCQRAAAAHPAAALPCSASLGFRDQFAHLPATVGAVTPGRTRCPACDAGYLGSADSRPPSADCSTADCHSAAAGGCGRGGGGCRLARPDLLSGGAGAATPPPQRASYSDKRGRGSVSGGGGGSGAWKSTFRSLSPFPLLKRSSSCSSPTSSAGKHGGGGASRNCCSGSSSDRRRKLCCATVTVVLLLLVALTVGLAVTYVGRQTCATLVDTTRVLGSFRVTQGPYAQYSPELGVNTSQTFSNWSSFMAAQINYVLSHSNLSDIYVGSEVLRFRPGSVFVDFRLTFDMTGSQPASALDQSTLRQTFLPGAMAAGSAAATVYLRSNYGSIAIDAASIVFSFDTNPDSLTSAGAARAANSTYQHPKPPASAGLCEPISVPECQLMFWNSTGTMFPNFAGDTSQVGLEPRVSILMLLTQHCYTLWNVFVCAAYVPPCSSSGASQVPPCRRLCLDALSSCKDWITLLQLEFPFNCSQFPDSQDPNTCVSSNVPPCPLNTFQCDNTSCHPMRDRCDGVIDCIDGTDEANCNNFTCISDQFRCTNRKCRPLIWVCDQHNDCGDNSDEVGCKPRGDCPANKFECSKGGYSLWNETSNCIPASYTCDKTIDCSDGSDEDLVYCHGREG